MIIIGSAIKHLWSFFVINFFFNSILYTQEKLLDQIYKQCDRLEAARLPLQCMGFPELTRTKDECITRRSCDMIAMVSVVPSKDGNHFSDKFDLMLIGNYQRGASEQAMSTIILDGFANNYADFGTYYNCSWTQKEPTVKVMVKNPGQIARSTGTGIKEGDLLICFWSIDRSSDIWPTDHKGRKVDVITRSVETILFKDGIKNSGFSSYLSIYRSRYLYSDCDRPGVKYCLGAFGCIAAHICKELLTVVQSPNKSDSLDFHFYYFGQLTNESHYDVTLYPADDSFGFQVICSKYSLEAYFISSNGSRDLSTSVLTSMFTYIDSEFDGIHCKWTMTKYFEISGVTFDTKTVKYRVQLDVPPFSYDERVPIALPGFQVNDSIYKDYSIKPKEQEYFGLNTDNPMEDCLTSRSCQAFAVFTVEEQQHWSVFFEPKMILDLYVNKSLFNLESSSMSRASPQSDVKMKLSLSTVNDKVFETVYKCAYNDRRILSSAEYPFSSSLVRRGSIFHNDWIHCQWIWLVNGTNWPTDNRSKIINVVNQRLNIKLAVNEVKKVFPAETVSLPIYKLRYFYQKCEETDKNLCLQSEPGCLESSNCTLLIYMKNYDHKSTYVQVMVTQDFHKLELIYVDPMENSIKLECPYDRGHDISWRLAIYNESFKIRDSHRFQPISTQFTEYPESRRFEMGFQRCSWLQKKHMSIGPFAFDSEANRYDIKLLVTNYQGSVARYSWDKVAIVGFKSNETQPTTTSSSLLSP